VGVSPVAENKIPTDDQEIVEVGVDVSEDSRASGPSGAGRYGGGSGGYRGGKGGRGGSGSRGGAKGAYRGGGGDYGGGGASGSYLPPVGSPSGEAFAERAPWIMENLQRDFGITREQAAGIVGNLGHESGGFRHFQELGSGPNTGGRGWAQWTGPRRVAFLRWSRAHGLDPRSNEANYGFLRHELQTTEARSLAAVRRAGTAREATYAFERTFERAGVKAYSSRLRYTARALAAGPVRAPVNLRAQETVAPGSPRLKTPEPEPITIGGPAGESGARDREQGVEVGAPELRGGAGADKLKTSRPYQTILPATITPYKRTTMFFPSDQHGNRNSVRRVTVYQVDDSKPQQTIWAKGLYKEEIKFGYRQQGFGLSTVPPEGSEGMAFEIAGRPDQMFFLESEHKDHRPTNKKPGESVLYDANGNSISLLKDSNGGQVEIKIDGAGKVSIKGTEGTSVEDASGITLTGPVHIDGDVTTTGSITSAGAHVASSHD